MLKLILNAFDKLMIMSEIAHDNWNRLKLLTGFIQVDSSLECLIEVTAALNI
jgi:hypothetical protein